MKKNQILGKPLLYVDLLGFSTSIMRQSLKDSLCFYEHFLSSLKSMYAVHSKLRFTFVSDTALLWIEGSNSENNIAELFEVAFTLLHNSLLDPEESIRGAIVFDEFEISDHKFTLGKSRITSPIIIGKAIISAYSWEQCQNWIGISLNPNSIDKFSDYAPELMTKLQNDRIINRYDVPTKHGYIQTFALGVHQSHIDGKIILKNKSKKDIFNVDKVWNVRSYFDLLEEKKVNLNDFGALSKLTETERYLRHLQSKDRGKLFDWGTVWP